MLCTLHFVCILQSAKCQAQIKFMNNISDTLSLLIFGVLLIAVTAGLRFVLSSFEARNERVVEKVK